MRGAEMKAAKAGARRRSPEKEARADRRVRWAGGLFAFLSAVSFSFSLHLGGAQRLFCLGWGLFFSAGAVSFYEASKARLVVDASGLRVERLWGRPRALPWKELVDIRWDWTVGGGLRLVGLRSSLLIPRYQFPRGTTDAIFAEVKRRKPSVYRRWEERVKRA
jgi:hypothetical protein